MSSCAWGRRAVLLAAFCILTFTPLLGEVAASPDGDGIVLTLPNPVVYREPGVAASMKVYAADADGPVKHLRITVAETGITALTNSRGIAIFSFSKDSTGSETYTFEAGPRYVNGVAQSVAVEPVTGLVIWGRLQAEVNADPERARPGETIQVNVSASFTHNGSAADGLRVTLDAGGETFEGQVDSTGRAQFTLTRADSTYLPVRAILHVRDMGQLKDIELATRLLWAKPSPDTTQPTATGTLDKSRAAINESLTLDASSSASTGRIISYLVDFGDGTPLVITGSPLVSHRYLNEGVFRGSLTVVDEYGRFSDAATFLVGVTKTPAATIRLTAGPAYDLTTREVTAEGRIEGVSEAVRSVRFRVNDGDWTPLEESLTWSLRVPLALGEGEHRIEVEVTTAEGVVTTESWTFGVASAKTYFDHLLPFPSLLLILSVLFLTTFWAGKVRKG